MIELPSKTYFAIGPDGDDLEGHEDSVVRNLVEVANKEISSWMSAHDYQIDRIKECQSAGTLMNGIIKEAQFILALCLSGAMSRKQATGELLGLLDGPDGRKAQQAWEAANV